MRIKISMPLYAVLGKKKPENYYFNLNNYRNWHYQVNNKLKKIYKKKAEKFIKNLRFENPIKLTFVLWKKDKRKVDRANPLCIHEKFFCDALTEFGCIPDDSDDYIESTLYRTGGICKENPRVDIIVEEIEKP